MVLSNAMGSLLNGKDALILFFGIYLMIVMNLIRKYRTFDVQLFFSSNEKRRNRFIRRFIVGFFLIDIFPVIWLLIMYAFVIAPYSGPFPIMAAAFAALSVLGFVKILHSIIATENHLKFYSADEFHYVVSNWGRDDDEDNTFKSHFISGIAYLIFFTLLAYLVGNIPVLIGTA
jgi:hypothetical protein